MLKGTSYRAIGDKKNVPPQCCVKGLFSFHTYRVVGSGVRCEGAQGSREKKLR